MTSFMTPVCDKCGVVNFMDVTDDMHDNCGGDIHWKNDGTITDGTISAIRSTGMDDYVITKDPIDEGIFSVWREGLTIPYEVMETRKGTWTCTCPHYVNRLRNSRGRCKHIDEVLRRKELGI